LGVATAAGHTFASIDFVPGTYVTTLVGPTGVSDSVIVNVGIPAPGTAALLGLGGFAAIRRRR